MDTAHSTMAARTAHAVHAGAPTLKRRDGGSASGARGRSAGWQRRGRCSCKSCSGYRLQSAPERQGRRELQGSGHRRRRPAGNTERAVGAHALVFKDLSVFRVHDQLDHSGAGAHQLHRLRMHHRGRCRGAERERKECERQPAQECVASKGRQPVHGEYGVSACGRRRANPSCQASRTYQACRNAASRPPHC